MGRLPSRPPPPESIFNDSGIGDDESRVAPSSVSGRYSIYDRPVEDRRSRRRREREAPFRTANLEGGDLPKNEFREKLNKWKESEAIEQQVHGRTRTPSPTNIQVHRVTLPPLPNTDDFTRSLKRTSTSDLNKKSPETLSFVPPVVPTAPEPEKPRETARATASWGKSWGRLFGTPLIFDQDKTEQPEKPLQSQGLDDEEFDREPPLGNDTQTRERPSTPINFDDIDVNQFLVEEPEILQEKPIEPTEIPAIVSASPQVDPPRKGKSKKGKSKRLTEVLDVPQSSPSEESKSTPFLRSDLENQI